MNEKTRTRKLFQILAIVKSMLPDEQEDKDEILKELPDGAKMLGEYNGVMFDDIFIINNKVYKQQRDGKYKRLHYTDKNGSKVYRLSYKDGEKTKTMMFNLSRWNDTKELPKRKPAAKRPKKPVDKEELDEVLDVVETK